MNKRGQIFLILTILVITFLVGITSVLLDIQKAEYYNPSPDADDTLQAWHVAVDSITQAMDVQLAVNSSAGDPSGPIDMSFVMNNIERYLNERGLSAAIIPTSVDYLVTNPNTVDTTLSLTGNFTIFLKSSTTEITQQIIIVITYRAQAPGSGIVLLTKSVNGEVVYLTNAVFDVVSTNNADGSYVVATGSRTATTSTGVQLVVNVI